LRAALEEWTRERVPLDWAMAQTNLGNVLVVLGYREGGTAQLEQAVAIYDAALDVLNAAGAEHYVELCSANRDRAVTLIAERRSHIEAGASAQ
jgi:hypothetical protein